MDSKRCHRCQHDLPLSQFYKSKDFRDGYTASCKACYASAQGKIYRGIKNKDRELPEGHLLCGGCNQVLPYTNFTRCNYKKSGYQSRCKECRNAARRKGEKPEVLPDGLKRCFDCKCVLPASIEFFSIDNRSPSGFQGRCKACYTKYRQANNEHIKHQKREHYQENRIEIRTQARTQYYEKHDYIRQRERDRYSKDRARIRGYAHRRRTRKLQLPDDFSVEMWQVCLSYWGNKCAVCQSDKKLELDHWIALKHPDCPGTILTNLIVLCKSCNCSKNATHPVDWLVYKLGEQAATQKLAEIEDYFEFVKNRSSEE
ncbi:MAG: hypothetical protein ABI690_17575 [Chloroflexota bacterium]